MKGLYPLILCCLLTTVSCSTMAEKDKQKRGHKPPPEAFTACEGRVEGDSDSIETPRGDTLEATCKIIDEQLVAVPAKDRHQSPPKE
ncbi:hypothetical protein [Flavobacterium sp. W21_SRS_FM6]|uniref:hypothetical protein n=1 Tax=Flavobacterium sp. W21_SRS_FM6 TaxID=3240268 RepID=UPI003F8FD70D